MARNKYPERTIEKILDTSLRLFADKGYDKTTIQDIVGAVGMSKGAIYHHFKCKEEILNALGDKFYRENDGYRSIKENPALTGLEKIRAILIAQISDHKKAEMDAISVNIWKDPKFFMMSFQENLTQNAKILEGMMQDGIEDGSIHVQDTTCASEVLTLLINYWVFSPMTEFTQDFVKQRVVYFRHLCESLGIPAIDDELEQMLIQYFQNIAEHYNNILP